MLLRNSEYKGNGTFGAVLEWAHEGKGDDANGYRAGFIELVRRAQMLKRG
jgi:Ca-activated chloride channel family protein